MWITRRYENADQQAVLALADRLAVGAPSWRSERLWLEAVRTWVDESILRANDQHRAVVVVHDNGGLAGFASLSARTHFTGAVDAYIGELVVAEWAEGQGAGRALLNAAEEWALRHNYRTLTLETEAANHRALSFYRRAGFQDEDVRLTKVLVD